MSQIYLNINNEQAGPFDVATVNQMLTDGQITQTTLGWMQGMSNWEAISGSTFANLGIGSTAPSQAATSTPAPTTSASPQARTNPTQQVKRTATATTSPQGAGGTFEIGKAIGEAFGFYKANLIGSIGWLIVAGIISCIPPVSLIVPLMGVNFYTCVKKFRADGTKMSFGDLFDFSRALDKIVGPIIVGILIGLGFICLIIPGIILTLMWVFTPCVQGDRTELSFIDAMKESRRLTKGNWLKIIIFIIILGLLATAGILLLGIGALVTIPVVHVALYCAYDQCKGNSA